MNASIKLATIAVSLLLVGVGCAAPTKSPDSEANQGATEETAKTEGTSTGSAVALTTTVELDDTWKTYTDRAKTFSFRWPSKGANAPLWEVTLVSEKDAPEGCVGEGDKRTVSVGGTTFCHTTATAGDVRTDRYATKSGSGYAVLTFTKTKPGTDYAAHLDQIVSTFSLTK